LTPYYSPGRNDRAFFGSFHKKTYAEAIREDFGFRFYLLPLASELFAEA